ncbi:hypothetical protein WDW37_17945 [Bdellovibrionota bacterium FG-1]
MTPNPSLFQNPIPLFGEAKDAASRWLQAQRESMALSAELRARVEAQRMMWWGIGFVLAVTTVGFTFFWITQGLREAGVSPWVLALSILVLLGGTAGLCFWNGQRISNRELKI